MANGRHVLQDHAESKRADDVHGLLEVFVLGKRDEVRLIAARVREQPHAHLGHDAKVGLAEEAVDIRTEAVWEELGGLVPWLILWSQTLGFWSLGVRKCSHPGSHQLSVGENDLHATVHHPMI